MNIKNEEIEYSEFLRNGKLFRRKLVKNNITHNMSNTRIYLIWKGIKRRCYNPNTSKYKYYGGKGIKIYDSWLGKDGFINFYEWAIDNGYDDSLSIDRINSNDDYKPSNCRWIGLKENRILGFKKKRIPKYEYKGINSDLKLCVKFYKIKDFSEKFGIDGRRISDCLNNKISSYSGWKFYRTKFEIEGQETIVYTSTGEIELPLEVQNIQ